MRKYAESVEEAVRFGAERIKDYQRIIRPVSNVRSLALYSLGYLLGTCVCLSITWLLILTADYLAIDNEAFHRFACAVMSPRMILMLIIVYVVQIAIRYYYKVLLAKYDIKWAEAYLDETD